MTYQEKLKDPRWQKKRLEIMNRDNFTCLKCNAKDKTLNVHHRWYEKNTEIWDYPNEVFETLCEDCHSNVNPELKPLVLKSIINIIVKLSQNELENLSIELYKQYLLPISKYRANNG